MQLDHDILKIHAEKDKQSCEMSMFLHRVNLSNQMLHNYSAILHELSHSLSQPPNLFTQIYLPYLWHFTTLETGEIDKTSQECETALTSQY